MVFFTLHREYITSLHFSIKLTDSLLISSLNILKYIKIHIKKLRSDLYYFIMIYVSECVSQAGCKEYNRAWFPLIGGNKHQSVMDQINKSLEQNTARLQEYLINLTCFLRVAWRTNAKCVSL